MGNMRAAQEALQLMEAQGLTKQGKETAALLRELVEAQRETNRLLGLLVERH